jgi:hypothetical protein
MNARPEQVMYTVRHMSEDSREDMRLLTWFESVEAYGLDRAASPGPKWAYTVAGVPLAVGGITMGRPHVATAWFIATEELAHSRLARYDLMRIIHAMVGRIMEIPEVLRLEAWCRESWPAAQRFAEAAHLVREGVHRAMCADGSSVVSYSLTRGNR